MTLPYLHCMHYTEYRTDEDMKGRYLSSSVDLTEPTKRGTAGICMYGTTRRSGDVSAIYTTISAALRSLPELAKGPEFVIRSEPGSCCGVLESASIGGCHEGVVESTPSSMENGNGDG